MATSECSNCKKDVYAEDNYCKNCGEQVNNKNINKKDVYCAREIINPPELSRNWKIIRWIFVVPSWIFALWSIIVFLDFISSWHLSHFIADALKC